MLMKLIVNLCLSSSELCQLNQCRLYLQVVSVADIATVDGKRLDQPYKDGIKVQQMCKSLEMALSTKSTKEGLAAVGRHSSAPGMEEFGVLQQRLGHWIIGFRISGFRLPVGL